MIKKRKGNTTFGNTITHAFMATTPTSDDSLTCKTPKHKNLSEISLFLLQLDDYKQLWNLHQYLASSY